MKALVVLFSIILIGCSHTKIVKPDQKFTYEGKSTIITIDGETIETNGVEIRNDKVLLRELAIDTIRYLHRSDINSVRILKNNTLKYALIGGAGGVAWTVLTADQWNDDDNSGYTFYWSAIMGGIGGGIGILVGNLQSGEYIYIIQHEKDTIEMDVSP